jgi:hypothetical protein
MGKGVQWTFQTSSTNLKVSCEVNFMESDVLLLGTQEATYNVRKLQVR